MCSLRTPSPGDQKPKLPAQVLPAPWPVCHVALPTGTPTQHSGANTTLDSATVVPVFLRPGTQGRPPRPCPEDAWGTHCLAPHRAVLRAEARLAAGATQRDVEEPPGTGAKLCGKMPAARARPSTPGSPGEGTGLGWLACRSPAYRRGRTSERPRGETDTPRFRRQTAGFTLLPPSILRNAHGEAGRVPACSPVVSGTVAFLSCPQIPDGLVLASRSPGLGDQSHATRSDRLQVPLFSS